MIDFDAVTDTPKLFGHHVPLLTEVDFHLPKGRYALLSSTPEHHRPLMDLLAGLRPPSEGQIRHDGRVSWVVGRWGFVRGHGNGRDMIQLLSEVYNFDADLANEVVTSLVSQPDFLEKAMNHWPAFLRAEFTFALALIPDFDVYIIDTPIPFEPSRFTRLWQALFEERLAGKTLILSSYRQNQLLDYCAKGLIHEHHSLKIDDDLEQCIERYPSRPSREDFGAGDLIGENDGKDDRSDNDAF